MLPQLKTKPQSLGISTMTTELLRSYRDIYELGSRDSSVTIVTRPRAGQLRNRGSIPSGGQNIILFSSTSRQTLGPTHPPV